MEDNLIFFENGTNLHIFENGRRPQLLLNGRRPQFFGKWKTTSDLFQKLKAASKTKTMQPGTFKINTMVVAPLWVTQLLLLSVKKTNHTTPPHRDSLQLGQFKATQKADFGIQPYLNPTRQNMEDDLNILKMEDNQNLFLMEDYLNFFLNGRRPQVF